MTTEEFAGLVRQQIDRARTYAISDPLVDDHRLGFAFESMAAGSMDRCLGPGREYEISASVQRFERRSAAEIIADAREEALDVPAYLTQLAHVAGVPNDPEIAEGILLAARLMSTLDRIEANLRALD